MIDSEMTRAIPMPDIAASANEPARADARLLSADIDVGDATAMSQQLG
jgi:hypothetical protein